jgi:hypothetical protein
VSVLLGVLPLGQSVDVIGAGRVVLTADDVDRWAHNPGATRVHFDDHSGAGPRHAGYCDRAVINAGTLFLYGDVDPNLPGGAAARWGIRESGVFDRLAAGLIARPDPLATITAAQRDLLRRHWGGSLPDDGPGVLISSLRVSAVGTTPDAAWLGA